MMKALSRISLAWLGFLPLGIVVEGETATTVTATVQSGGTLAITSAAPIKTHTVQVGKGDHTFKPDVTKADIGDIIEFLFFPANHSVVRAEYEYPCVPIDTLSPAKANISFFSGFHPVSTVLDNPPKWQIRINDTKPVFFYCSAPGSCTNFGMVGAINPRKTSDLQHQHDLAKRAAYQLQPGEPFPAEDTPAVLPSSLPSDPPTAPTPVLMPRSGGKHLSPSIIAGIVIASVFVLILVALLFFYIGRTKPSRDEAERADSTVSRLPSITASASHFSNASTRVGTSMSERMPPAYFGAKGRKTSVSQLSSSERERRMSHRSMGGTFDLSPTGVYQRTHERASSPGSMYNESPVLGRWAQVNLGQQPFAARQNSIGFTPLPHFSARTGGEAPSYFEHQLNGPMEADGREVQQMF